ncbi:unnamed protein product [Protopolystoma xenopodis]|uniref:Uncharacterized protein n=1 Tax=Protopolystoma xenopodis TaxID=117903 RepID=A0A3S5AL55_9PLAT|nr:unnamed protein product [Protopolystoma xenopodis]
MTTCSDDARCMMHFFTGIEEDYLANRISMDLPVEPIDSWLRGICRRLFVEPTIESLHQTLSLEMKVSSTIIKMETYYTLMALVRRQFMLSLFTVVIGTDLQLHTCTYAHINTRFIANIINQIIFYHFGHTILIFISSKKTNKLDEMYSPYFV